MSAFEWEKEGLQVVFTGKRILNTAVQSHPIPSCEVDDMGKCTVVPHNLSNTWQKKLRDLLLPQMNNKIPLKQRDSSPTCYTKGSHFPISKYLGCTMWTMAQMTKSGESSNVAHNHTKRERLLNMLMSSVNWIECAGIQLMKAESRLRQKQVLKEEF